MEDTCLWPPVSGPSRKEKEAVCPQPPPLFPLRDPSEPKLLGRERGRRLGPGREGPLACWLGLGEPGPPPWRQGSLRMTHYTHATHNPPSASACQPGFTSSSSSTCFSVLAEVEAMHLCRVAWQALASSSRRRRLLFLLPRAPGPVLRGHAPFRQMSSGSVPGSSGENMIYYLIVVGAASAGGFYAYRTVTSDKARYNERVEDIQQRSTAEWKPKPWPPQ